MKTLLSLAIIIVFSVSTFALNQNGDFADFEGQKVYFKSFGKGKKAIIFIHGWACNADFWSESYTSFPEHRVIAVDLIGHGRSDKPKTAYTIDYFAKSVEAVMKKAKVKEAVLVGHSMGTPVARQFYRLYPEKMKGLVIVDGALRAYGDKAASEAFIAPLRANYQETAKLFVGGMIQPIKDEKLKEKIRNAMLSTADYVGIGAMEHFSDEALWEKTQIKVPVLAIMANSTAWRPDEKEFFQTIAPSLDYQKWEGVSHFLMMEKPKEFNAEVKAFIVKNKLL